jgi:hypothetical protein
MGALNYIQLLLGFSMFVGGVLGTVIICGCVSPMHVEFQMIFVL